jgi:hypothetical protein
VAIALRENSCLRAAGGWLHAANAGLSPAK